MAGLDLEYFDSVFHCPVCGQELVAGKAKPHLDAHKFAGDVPPDMTPLIKSLSNRAQALHNEQIKQLMRQKQIETARLPSQDNRDSGDGETLHDYDKLYRSDDLWERRRPYSGGGGPGSGRRR